MLRQAQHRRRPCSPSRTNGAPPTKPCSAGSTPRWRAPTAAASRRSRRGTAVATWCTASGASRGRRRRRCCCERRYTFDMNYRFVATEVGDALKYETSVNQIDRLARSLFNFQREDFPHEAITSVRAQTVYDWILSLAKQEMDPKRRDELLLQFCRALTSESSRPAVERILRNAGGG